MKLPDPPRELLIAVGNDRDLAALIAWNIGSAWEEWLATEIPALAGRKPANLVGTRHGREMLRSMLMKMP
jgi:uncharacterized protein (DUF2384 family)